MNVMKPLVPRQMQCAAMQKLTKIDAKDQDEVQDITDDSVSMEDLKKEKATS